MPTYPHMDRYYEGKQRFIDYGGSDNEQNIRRAVASCLDAHCRDHRDNLALIDELDTPLRNRPAGTVRDSLRMTRGYWEAADTHDDLDGWKGMGQELLNLHIGFESADPYPLERADRDIHPGKAMLRADKKGAPLFSTAGPP